MRNVSVLLLTLSAIALVATPVRAADAGPLDAPEKGMPIPFAVQIEPDPVLFAAPFVVLISLERNVGERYILPGALPENSDVRPAGEPVRTETPVAQNPGRVKETIAVPFVALGLDDLETPEFVLTGPDGQTLDIPSLTVTVRTPDADIPEDKREAPGFAKGRLSYGYEVTDHRPKAVLYTAILAALLTVLFDLWMRRRRIFVIAEAEHVHVDPDAPPLRPAHELAYERLDALLAEGLLQRGEVTPFVTRLMDEVLRSYIEARFDVQAEASTTRELCEELLTVTAPGLNIENVRRILESADLIKFAKAQAAPQLAHQMAQHVRGLIDATRAAPTDDEAKS